MKEIRYWWSLVKGMFLPSERKYPWRRVIKATGPKRKRKAAKVKAYDKTVRICARMGVYLQTAEGQEGADAGTIRQFREEAEDELDADTKVCRQLATVEGVK